MTIFQKLDTPPTTLVDYIQADYIELLCLVHPDREISQYEVSERFKENADLDDQLVLESDSDLRSEKNDDEFERVLQWFKQLEYRKLAFGDIYPFELTERGTVLRRNPSLTEYNKLYIYFLYASSLRHFAKGKQIKFANSFEILCAAALRQYLPETAIVDIFGSNPLSNSRYSGRKYEKIKILASDLYERLICEETDFEMNDSGDAGLDIVAWLPVDDDNPGWILIFGQCACTMDWVEKQHSSSFEQWNSLIHFSVRPNNLVFIPFCFRGIDGRWYTPTKIHMSILMDRLRLLKLLRTINNPLGMLPNDVQNDIDQAINFEESIV